MIGGIGFVSALVFVFIGLTLLNKRIPAPVELNRVDMEHCAGCANVACAFKPKDGEEG